MALRLAEALAAALLEDADLRPALFAIDHAGHLGVGDKRCAGEHLAAFLLDEQHLIDRDFLAGFGREVVHGDDRSGGDLDLAAAALNDCEHVRTPHAMGRRTNRRPGRRNRFNTKVLG